MTVSTAVPNGYNSIVGTWNAFSGSTALGIGSAVAVVTDSSNNTYVRSTALTSGFAVLEYDLASVTVGSSAISRVRAGVIVKNGDGNPASIRMFTPSTSSIGTAAGPLSTTYYNASTAGTIYTGWWTQSTAWGTADANLMTMRISSFGTALRWTKAWMEYDLVSIPAGTPAVTAVNTDRPTVTWTFSDADGFLQASAVVKIFSSAQYSAGGFSASTSTPLWSGTVNGTASTITPSTAIVTNGLFYKPFLQVFKNVDQTVIPQASFASATAVSTASFTAPAAPTVQTTWDNTYKRVQVTVTGGTSPYRIVIFRGTAYNDEANDTNYALLKDSRQSDGTSNAYDYFVPRGTQIVYGALTNTGTVTPFLQSAVTRSTVTTGSATAWELRSVDDPNTYYNFTVPVTGINFDQYEGQTVFRPLGSNYPVVVAGDIGGDDGSMTIVTTNQTTWDNIKTMLDLQSDLYLVAPFVDSNNLARRWFVRVTGRSWVESGVPAAQVRTATVSFVEVEPPAVAAE